MAHKIDLILCPINLRHAAVTSSAYDEAVALARMHGARMHVITVAPEFERNLNIRDSKSYWTDKLIAFLRANPAEGVDMTNEVLNGAVHRRIVTAARERKADLVVMEAANPKVEDYLLGTTASHVVTHCACSVYIVRAP